MKKVKNKELFTKSCKQELQRASAQQKECHVQFTPAVDEETGKESFCVGFTSAYQGEVNEENAREVYHDVLKKFTGTENLDLAVSIFQKTSSSLNCKTESERYSLASQFLSETKPKDAIEAFLFAQILTLQDQGLTYLRLLKNSEMICHAEHNIKTAAKLLQLQHSAIDKLLRYRTGGEQKVVVQHVQVNNGGKAIVGSFEATGGGVIPNSGGVTPC